MTFSFSTAAPRARFLAPLAVALLLVGSSPSAGAQVGHLPDKSPYEDVKPGQTLSLSVGQLGVKRDPANVAPAASPFVSLRYDLPVGGPAALYARYSFAPSDRNVLDPTKPRATRLVGKPNVMTHVMDLGLDVSLTGQKTWRHLMPSLTGGLGVVSDFASADTARLNSSRHRESPTRS